MVDENEDLAARDRRLKRFQIFVGVGLSLIVGSAFGPEQFNLVPALPLFIGGCCARYLWKFQKLNENTRTVLSIAFGLFIVSELIGISHGVRDRDLLRDIRDQCSRPGIAHTPQCDHIRAAVAERLNGGQTGE